MNKERRIKILNLVCRLEDLEAQIEDIVQEETNYLDSMPEAFQDSEKGENTQETIATLENAQNTVPEVISYLEEACN